MHPVRPAIPGYEGPRFHRTEGRVRRILRALRAAHSRTVLERAVPDPAASEIADREQGIVGRHSNAVRKQAAVHDLAQHTVARVLVHGARLVGQIRARSGPPRVREEKVPLGVEIEVVGPFEQLIAVGIDERLQLFRLRVVDQDATVPRRYVELALEPACALRLAGLTQLPRWVAVEPGDQLAVWRQIRNPSAADRHEPQIALSVERPALQELALRRAADIGEFFHWADARWQWRQPPGLNQVRCLSLGRTSETASDTENPEKRGRQTLDQVTVHSHGALPSSVVFLGKSSR